MGRKKTLKARESGQTRGELDKKLEVEERKRSDSIGEKKREVEETKRQMGRRAETRSEQLSQVIGGGSYLARSLYEWELKGSTHGSGEIGGSNGKSASLGGLGQGAVESRQPFQRSVSAEAARRSKQRLGPTAGRRDTRPKVHLTIKFNPNTSVVSVVVHRVTNLNETSHTFLPNPYVKLYLVEAVYSSNVRDIYSKKKTKVKKNTVNPVFEDTLEYFIPQYNLKHHRIEV